GLVAVRIEPPAVELLRADRRAAGRAQEARRRARGRRRPLGRAGIRDVPARTEVPVPRAPRGLRQGALRRTRYFARGRGGAPEGRCRELAVFGAPAALFCYIDRDLGSLQWADVGMYLQTVMLLLRAEGLHSCLQMAWSVYRKTVAEIVSPPDGLILFCGMSIGFEDVTVGFAHSRRAPLDETVTFVEDQVAGKGKVKGPSVADHITDSHQ